MLKILSYFVNKSLFGIEIEKVKEINRNVEFTPVPDARKSIVGLHNMRGNIVTIFDFAKLIGMEKKTPDTSTCIILKALGNSNDLVGFLIDKPGDVIDVDNDYCEAPPANIRDADEYISSVVRLKDDLMILINPEKIFK